MHVRLRLALGILLLSVLLAVSSCTVLRDPIVGTWVLASETVNDSPISVGTGPSQVSGTFTIKADHTLRFTGTSEGATVVGAGSWTKNGSTYSFALSYNSDSRIGSSSLLGSLGEGNKVFSGIGNGIDSPGGAYTWRCTLQRLSSRSNAEITLFDSEGSPVAHISSRDQTIYLWSGQPVAYIDYGTSAPSVYGFYGKHLGWYDGGLIRDHEGYCAGFAAESVSSVIEKPEPVKGIKGISPIKSIQQIEPMRPIEPVSAIDGPQNFSATSLYEFLMEGAK